VRCGRLGRVSVLSFVMLPQTLNCSRYRRGATEWWGGECGADIPASPAVEMEPIVTATTRCLRAVEGLSMGERR
jgi:hypothetical protein